MSTALDISVYNKDTKAILLDLIRCINLEIEFIKSRASYNVTAQSEILGTIQGLKQRTSRDVNRNEEGRFWMGFGHSNISEDRF